MCLPFERRKGERGPATSPDPARLDAVRETTLPLSSRPGRVPNGEALLELGSVLFCR